MRGGPLAEGEPALLMDRKQRRYLITLRAGAVTDLRGGKLAHDDLIGSPEGRLVRTTRGESFVLLRPTLAEFVLEMPRGAQIIYPKDLSMILLAADIYPGATVLEAGTGSGALTMTLLRAVGPQGRVYSYEVRDEFARRAAQNIARYVGVADHLVVRMQDVYEGIPDGPLDRIVLDVPEPWRVVPHAAAVLRQGGIQCSYVPTVPQVAQTVEALRGSKAFALIETFETLVRPWNIEGASVRPAHRMVAHTAFITTARRVVLEKPGVGSRESGAENREPGVGSGESRAGTTKE
jgi:tRNA (adenine57-N1/adenine58-N1)-methyltransferase catalytic subunit